MDELKLLEQIAQEYEQKYYFPEDELTTGIETLYDRYFHEHKKILKDLLLTVSSLTIDRFQDLATLSPELKEAFSLAFPGKKISDLMRYSNDQLPGVIAQLKGKYFEVLVRNKLNSGAVLDGLHLLPGQTAELASKLNQPGWDLLIKDAHGSIVDKIQLKATSSLSYIKKAIEKYPDFKIVATREAAAQGDHLINTTISNSELHRLISDRVHDIHDLLPHDLYDLLVIGLPLSVITLDELIKVKKGKKDKQEALRDGTRRSTFYFTALALYKTLLISGASAPLAIIVGVFVRLSLSRLQNKNKLIESFIESKFQQLALLEKSRTKQSLPSIRFSQS